jgi:predicted phosphate transport protein (TIGR00153 family)
MFMPKEMKFFDLFDKQMSILIDGAKYFREIITEGNFTRDSVDKMHAIEHAGDEMTHIIIQTLNESFITPFDREDVLDLVNGMDDIIDGLYLIANRFYLYKIQKPSEESIKLSEVIENSVKALQKVITLMRSNKNMKEVLKQCIEINRLENLADDIRDEAISKILNVENGDPIMVIKQKELFEAAEAVTDHCEHVANVVDSIIVKNN